MALKSSAKSEPQLTLMRGSRVVSTLTGAFGQSLRETRLTALLGYIIAIKPEPFIELFGFKGTAQEVRLETREATGRTDIAIETSLGLGVIEAKVSPIDPLKQSQKYPARWRALLTHQIPGANGTRTVRYVTWQDLADKLFHIQRGASPRLRFLCQDLVAYLEEHRMIKKKESIEVYAREINEPVTLQFFLKAQLYGCEYERSSKVGEALYFAPHFGKKIAKNYPGVNVGISYIAKIEAVRQATTWQEFRDLVHTERGAVFLTRHAELFKDVHRKWTWNKKMHRTFLFLAEPRLVFNPPVDKTNLQKGSGWLSKRVLSFDELFKGWGA